MRGRTMLVVLAVAALALAPFSKASAGSMSAKIKKMMEAGLCKELGPNDTVPENCSTYYGHCYFKKFPISESDCNDPEHSNRPLVVKTGSCVPVSRSEIRMNGNRFLINQKSCGNENSTPNVTACKAWGKSYLGKLRGCQAKIYWKEVYYCVQTDCGAWDASSRGVYRGTAPGYEKGDKAYGYESCEKEEYAEGYYYYITAHPAEMQLSCKHEEVWKKAK